MRSDEELVLSSTGLRYRSTGSNEAMVRSMGSNVINKLKETMDSLVNDLELR